MNNLEQLRAKNAWDWKKKIESGKKGGEVVKKLPTMIRTNGLLAALARAVEPGKDGKPKNEGDYSVFRAILAHLKTRKLVVSTEPEAFVKEITGKDSSVLRQITAETLAYLNYLRRFVSKEKDHV